MVEKGGWLYSLLLIDRVRGKGVTQCRLDCLCVCVCDFVCVRTHVE